MFDFDRSDRERTERPREQRVVRASDRRSGTRFVWRPWPLGCERTSSDRGPAIQVDFVLRYLRLYMTMVIDLADGSRRTIKAVFDRPWLGA